MQAALSSWLVARRVVTSACRLLRPGDNKRRQCRSSASAPSSPQQHRQHRLLRTFLHRLTPLAVLHRSIPHCLEAPPSRLLPSSSCCQPPAAQASKSTEELQPPTTRSSCRHPRLMPIPCAWFGELDS